MSHRRVKNLAVEDDYYDDEYDDGDAGVEMTDEDREQMQVGTAMVRSTLGPAFSNLASQDIEEALWHYYYDVDKSVEYLKSAFWHSYWSALANVGRPAPTKGSHA